MLARVESVGKRKKEIAGFRLVLEEQPRTQQFLTIVTVEYVTELSVVQACPKVGELSLIHGFLRDCDLVSLDILTVTSI